MGNTDALIRARQAELRVHVAENSAILRRERWREQVASAAAGMPERFKRETKSGRFVYTQDEVDAAVEKYAGNVRFGAEPKANPRLKAYGKTHVVEVSPGYRKTVSIEIGPQKDGGECELADTILHEAMEEKMMLRNDKRLAGGDAEAHPYIDKIIARHAELKGLW